MMREIKFRVWVKGQKEMLDTNKIKDSANNLGVGVRFDREPGIYEKDGTFNSYESVMTWVEEKQ